MKTWLDWVALFWTVWIFGLMIGDVTKPNIWSRFYLAILFLATGIIILAIFWPLILTLILLPIAWLVRFLVMLPFPPY